MGSNTYRLPPGRWLSSSAFAAVGLFGDHVHDDDGAIHTLLIKGSDADAVKLAELVEEDCVAHALDIGCGEDVHGFLFDAPVLTLIAQSVNRCNIA